MIGEKLYNFKRGEYVPGLENEICALFERLGLEKWAGYTLLCMPASNWVTDRDSLPAIEQ